MARHAADFRYYEDFAELAQRYREQGLTELLKYAEKGMERCRKEKYYRPTPEAK
jgi:hypothetical protein